TIALNAYIFGYGGHSLVTPHTALKQLWWTDERIERKVTRSFVVSKLRGEERQFLDKPLAFGEGLTDGTYMDWILERAKRLFLILTVIGVPDQIFGCIDDSWDDDDLPLPLGNVKCLDLSYDHDEALDRRFYDVQFLYLLRELRPGAHIEYGTNEHIPMDHANTLPPAVSLQRWDRVHFPSRPEEVYMRRKYLLTDKETGCSYAEAFARDIQQARALHHEHIANVWASYTSQDAGYVLSDFVGEHTLGTFIDHRMPIQFMHVKESDRPRVLCEWMHCLADALACLHHRGVAHAAIRPSNILIDHDNHIAFADVGTIPTFQRGKKPHKSETYDYAAPESQFSRLPIVVTSSPPLSSNTAFSKLAKTNSGNSSSSASSGCSSTKSINVCTTAATSPTSTPLSIELTPEMSDIYSLGCIFLDVVTFILRGKLTDFVKFRSTRMQSVPLSSSVGKVRTDHSFHGNPEKVDVWIMLLKEESAVVRGEIFRGVPELLKLIRRMLMQNATLRPSARTVRDRLQEVLVDQCGMNTLCCAGREWIVPAASES
ncbi:hypothetical protein BAUCODRAFT_53930, partial [Baudoinia panamericana UAMH 10762]